MAKTTRLLVILFGAFLGIIQTCRLRADFQMTISVDGPSGPLAAGDIANFDINVNFTSDLASEFVNSISFRFSNPSSAELLNELTRFSAVDVYWVGGYDTVTGDGNFTADLGNEIFNSNSPQTVGRIQVSTTGLAPGSYDLYVQSTDWLVTGDADGENLLYDGNTAAGTGNSITFPPVVSFTIQAVPEPSSLMLIAVVSGFGCFARRPRK